MALFSLGNVQIGQAQKMATEGITDKAVAKFEEAMETHSQALKLYNITLGPKHHKTADALHKCAWHLHRKRSYQAAM
jgi:hypothetical protein